MSRDRDDTRTTHRHQRRKDDEREDRFLRDEDELARLVGSSPQIKAVKEQLRRFAVTDAPMLLLGASGTGKGLVADVIHALSQRSGELEAVNCATLSRDLSGSQLFGHRRGAFTGAVDSMTGAIEKAHSGTLFLDEVTDLPTEVQPALLTVLEDGHYHPLGESQTRHSSFRVVAATARPIDQLAAAGEFRGDLYARLRKCTIRLPDLSDRGTDVILIAEHLLPEICVRIRRERVRLSPGARGRLLDCPWPGNVRDLGSVLMHAAVLAQESVIDPATMDEAIGTYYGQGQSSGAESPLNLREAEANFRRKRVSHALLMCDGNKAAAAEMLGVSPSTLYRWRKELGVA
jgi:DNA-binding NtrC family response regulator